jgi:hypothetical protein
MVIEPGQIALLACYVLAGYTIHQMRRQAQRQRLPRGANPYP